MMESKNFLISLILVLSFTRVYSQNQKIATTDIATNAKIFFLSKDTSFYSYSQTLNFLSDTSNVQILSSKGFREDMVFVKIKIRGNFEVIRKEKIADSLYSKNRVPFSCDYIIACGLNEKIFYRLKGFGSNDFPQLFSNSYKKNDKVFFLNQFWVDELDLSCLFDNHFIRRKGTSSCLQSCNDRDAKFVKIKSD